MLLQVVRILLGLFLAILAAIGLGGAMGLPLVPRPDIFEPPIFTVAKAAWPYVPFLAALGVCAVAVAELGRFRQLIYWVLAGCVVAMLSFHALQSSGTATAGMFTAGTPLKFIVMGAVGGLVHWLVAGRKAGTLSQLAGAGADLAGTTAEHEQRRCAACAALWLLLGGVPFALLGWQLFHNASPTLASRITAKAEADAGKMLQAAGLPGLAFKVNGYTGHITGTAADAAAKAGAFAKARDVLAPLVGAPGVVAVLQNDIIARDDTDPRVAAENARIKAAEAAEEEARQKAAALAAEIEAKRKADEERQIKAEAERVARLEAERKAAEEEARKKAEVEAERVARAKAEAARLAAELEAKRKAEDEARAKAEAGRLEREAQAKREEAARLAEAEAKRKAEDETRAKAEAERLEREAQAKRDEAARVSEAEAKRKAEDEARAKTEAERLEREVQAKREQAKREAAEADARKAAEKLAADIAAKRKSAEDAQIKAEAERVAQVERERQEAERAAQARAAADKLAAEAAAKRRSEDEARAKAEAQSLAALPQAGTQPGSAQPATEMAPASPDTAPAAAEVAAFDQCSQQLDAITKRRKIFFKSSSAELRRAHSKILDAVAALSKRCTGMTIIVSGHTDYQGKEETNQQLSEERAEAVRAALVERGVDSKQLEARAYAWRQPVDGVIRRRARAADRRAEFSALIRTPAGQVTR